MDTKYLVTKNIIYNFGGQITLLLLGLITTPYIIHHLGNDLYAILSLVGVFIGYLSILDLGLGLSIIKYLSEYHAKEDSQSLQKLIGTALVVYTGIGFLGLVLTLLFTNLIVTQFLHVPREIIPTALTVFYLSGLGFFINMILTVFNAIPNALQRMDISNSRTVVFGILNTLGVLFILSIGGSLVIVVGWNIFVSVIATLVFIRIVRKLLPKVSFKLQFEKDIFIKLTKFGGFKLISNIAGQIVFQLDKLIIGFFSPLAAVTFYVVPNILVQKGFMLMLNITNAIFPAMSHSLTINDTNRTKDLYLRMTKLITLMIFPVMAFMFISAFDILQVWVGIEYAVKGTLVLQILSVAYFVAAMAAPGVVAADAAGKPQLSALFASISAGINLVAACILIPMFGIEGAAWAQLISFVCQIPIFLILVNRQIIKVSTLEVITKSIIKPLMAGIFAAIVVFLGAQFLQINFLNLILKACMFSLIYLLINYLIGTFDELDYQALKHLKTKLNINKI